MSSSLCSVIYLDENASATPSPRATEAATMWLSGPPANASSVHRLGRSARGAVEQSRRDLAMSLGVSPRHITFTSSATEAIHTVICGLLTPDDHVVVSAVEHPATWGALRRSGAETTIVPVDALGRINPDHFRAALRPNTKLAVMMAAQNELGVTYPTRLVAEVIGDIPLVVDAAQAYGKVELSLPETGATFAILSGHKMGAPLGVGALWCREGEPFDPLLLGGAQERGRRAGTENIPAIVGFGVAAREVKGRLSSLLTASKPLRALRERVASLPNVELLGTWGELRESDAQEEVGAWRAHGQLPNTLCLRLLRHEGDLILQRLDLEGYCVSSGSACSSGALEPSPVLKALGLSEEAARRGLRVSIGPTTSPDAIAQFTESLSRLIQE